MCQVLPRWGRVAAILGVLAACSSAPPPVSVPPPAGAGRTGRSAPAALAAAGARPFALGAGDVQLNCPAGTATAPASCGRRCGAAATSPAPDWAAFCRRRAQLAAAGDAAPRAWLQQRLQPYRVESPDGSADGLLTGYFEPLVEASRQPRAARTACRSTARRRDLATPQAVLDAPADRHPAGRAGRAARARARLRGRPAGCARAADPGLGPAALSRARTAARSWCASPTPATTTSPTSRSAAG